MAPAAEDAGAAGNSEAVTAPPRGSGLAHLPALARRQLDSGAAVRASIKAGVLGIFIGVIPILGIVLTGALAVYFYRREKGASLPAGSGARIGGAAGIVLFAINALFTIPIIVFHAQQECIKDIVEIAQKIGIDTATPQFQAGLSRLFTPAGLASSCVIALVLTALGGAVAARVMRDPPAS